MRHNYDAESNIKMFFRLIAIIVVMSLLGIFLSALFSCNPTRKAYKGIIEHEPKDKQDSAAIATRYNATFKTKPPRVIQGKTITKTVVKIDSSKVKGLIKTTDSLFDQIAARDGLLNQLSPDAIDSIKREVRIATWNECQPIETTIEHNTIDTVEVPDKNCESQLWLSNEASTQKDLKIAVIEDKLKSRNKLIWWLIGFCIVLSAAHIARSYFNIKKKLPIL